MWAWLMLLVELIAEAVRAGLHLGFRRFGEDVARAREALANDPTVGKDLKDILGQFPPALPAPAATPAEKAGPPAPVEPDGEKPPKRGPGRPSKEEVARRAAEAAAQALAQQQNGGQQQ